MAIPIHSSPELTGLSAQMFEEEMEKHVARGPLSAEEIEMLRKVEEKSRIMREKLAQRRASKQNPTF
ncbi:MAG: hypothetical protein LIO79_08820 [Rikenellaceae bacterium]|nr:hypothetical protein [Rikenellaceae bacterium]MCC8112539.1 hypothetical protein [Bacteroidales bacterium]